MINHKAKSYKGKWRELWKGVVEDVLRRQDSKAEWGSDMQSNASEHFKMGNIFTVAPICKDVIEHTVVQQPDGWSRKSPSFRSEAGKIMCCWPTLASLWRRAKTEYGQCLTIVCSWCSSLSGSVDLLVQECEPWSPQTEIPEYPHPLRT